MIGGYNGDGLDCEVWCCLLVQDSILKIIQDLRKLLLHITPERQRGRSFTE